MRDLLQPNAPVGMYEGSSIRWAPGLVNFVPGVAYHFCLNLHAAFSQPGNGLIYWSPVDICILNPMILPVEARVLMLGLSYPTETVLSNNNSRNRIFLGL